MDLYLIRHAIAGVRDPEAWPDDSDRPLTARGRRRWRLAARGLAATVPRPGRVLSSPLARAWETAEILAQETGWPAPERCDALALDGLPQGVLNAVGDGDGGAVALVGHEPSLHELASFLLSGDAERVRMEFKKGGCACIRMADRVEAGSGVLQWLLTPKALRSLRP